MVRGRGGTPAFVSNAFLSVPLCSLWLGKQNIDNKVKNNGLGEVWVSVLTSSFKVFRNEEKRNHGVVNQKSDSSTDKALAVFCHFCKELMVVVWCVWGFFLCVFFLP